MRATCWRRQNNPGELPGCEILMENKIRSKRRGRGFKRIAVSISNSTEGNSSSSGGKLQHDCTAHLPLPADLQAAPALSHWCSSQSQIKPPTPSSQGYRIRSHSISKVGIIRIIKFSAMPTTKPCHQVPHPHIFCPTFFGHFQAC